MSDWQIDEERLHRLNNTLSRADDVIIYNCITRTAQESKLFPLMPYLMLCFYDAYYRFPDLIREASEHITPEEIGHRVRESSMLPSKLSAWGTLNFYLNGRASLIKLGLLAPEDNLEDLVTVVDWWERFNRSYHRNSGRLWSYDQGDMSPELPERVLQVMEADAWEADDRLRKAASRFMATGTQYLFLANCESRLTLQASGPYRLGDNLLLHTRDFMNLGASDYSWLDGIADDMPYNNLTLSVITRDVAIEITDWAQIYTSPEDYQDKILGVGLYTSDWLTDTYQPVGMGSPTELADTLEAITDAMAQATRRLYTRFTEMSARQMTEAGIYVYLAAASGISHLAGTYQHEQWELIDHRTDRLWALHNEEYSLDSYLDNFAVMAGYQASQNEYYLHPVGYSGWRKGGGKGPLPAPGRNAFPVPATVLSDHDYTRRVNPKGMASVQGVNHLPPKSGGWLTSKGTLSQDELNRAVREFRSPLAQAPWVNYDEQWVKWNAGTSEADELYRHVQRGSRLLDGAGSSLLRDDLMKRRAAAGEPSWSDLSGGGGLRMTDQVPARWVVTGGSRGIGAAIVAAAVEAGDHVAVLSRSVEPGDDRSPSGGRVLRVRADVSDPASLAEAAQAVTSELGGVDVLVNNAGVHRGGKLASIDREAFLEVIATNLVGPFDTIQAFLPSMPDGSAIVNIGAVVGLRGFPGDVPYASAKAGLTGLTLALAMELAPRGITVNVVVPGFTATEMTAGLSERARESILGRIPMRREATAAEVADVVRRVAASSYMTGAVVPVDGGLMAALGSAR